MNGGVLALVLGGLICLAAGAYIAFVQGNVLGVVFIGSGGILISLAGVRQKQNQKDHDDAGR